MKLGNSPIRKLLGFAVVVMGTLASRADLIIVSGNNPQPNEQNVLFNSTQTGSTITGVTNLTNSQVSFTSSTDTLAVNAQGQAVLTSAVAGDLINDLTISAPGTTFADIILNPQIPNPSTGLTGPWDLLITVSTTTGVYTYTFPTSGKDALGNGNNFITFLGTNGTLINQISLTSTSGIDDLTQVRLSGLAVTPEPESIVLMGAGLSVLALLVRRRL